MESVFYFRHQTRVLLTCAWNDQSCSKAHQLSAQDDFSTGLTAGSLRRCLWFRSKSLSRSWRKSETNSCRHHFIHVLRQGKYRTSSCNKMQSYKGLKQSPFSIPLPFFVLRNYIIRFQCLGMCRNRKNSVRIKYFFNNWESPQMRGFYGNFRYVALVIGSRE